MAPRFHCFDWHFNEQRGEILLMGWVGRLQKFGRVFLQKGNSQPFVGCEFFNRHFHEKEKRKAEFSGVK